MDTIEVYSVGLGHYEMSLPLGKENEISANDALAFFVYEQLWVERNIFFR